MATLAAGDPLAALRLGVSMTALQASIGVVNDLIDAPHDAGRVPPKPIPAGFVSVAAARVGAGVAAGLGLILAVPSGAPTVAVALVVLGIGYGYDRFAKGTAWSWLPFAVGIPLLPVYGWLGAAGELPGSFAILVPVAMLAGVALAISNALADLERDEAAGVVSVARRLGRHRAWRVQGWLHVAVVVLAVGTLAVWRAPSAAIAGAVVGGAIVLLGVALGRTVRADRRQRAWECEAVGLGVLAIAWIAGVSVLGGAGGG